jgi:hypothetical protein
MHYDRRHRRRQKWRENGRKSRDVGWNGQAGPRIADRFNAQTRPAGVAWRHLNGSEEMDKAKGLPAIAFPASTSSSFPPSRE